MPASQLSVSQADLRQQWVRVTEMYNSTPGQMPDALLSLDMLEMGFRILSPGFPLLPMETRRKIAKELNLHERQLLRGTKTKGSC